MLMMMMMMIMLLLLLLLLMMMTPTPYIDLGCLATTSLELLSLLEPLLYVLGSFRNRIGTVLGQSDSFCTFCYSCEVVVIRFGTVFGTLQLWARRISYHLACREARAARGHQRAEYPSLPATAGGRRATGQAAGGGRRPAGIWLI